MKKTLIICAALLGLAATSAFASGVNLSWTDCLGSGFGTQNEAYACLSNSNGTTKAPLTHFLYSSYIPPAIDDLVGGESVLDLQTQNSPLAPWWDFNGCRGGFMSFGFKGQGASAPCLDWPGPNPVSGNLTETNGFGGPARARITTICAYTAPPAQALNGTSEYVYSLFVITNDNTVAPQTVCARCTDAVCIVLNTIKLGRLSHPDQILNNAATRNFATWNDATAQLSGCPGATPTRNSTWGQVKSLYR